MRVEHNENGHGQKTDAQVSGQEGNHTGNWSTNEAYLPHVWEQYQMATVTGTEWQGPGAYLPELYPYLLPWWLRWPQPDYCWWTPHDPYSRYFDSAMAGRGYFTQSFPHWLPYFPTPSPDEAWADPWSMQPYHGYWWS